MSDSINHMKTVTSPCRRFPRSCVWEPRAEPKYTVRPIIRKDGATNILAVTGHNTHSDKL